VIVEIVTRVGDPPLRIPAAQCVVRQDNGTIIAVAAEYGPHGDQQVSCAGKPDFNRTLTLLGIRETVLVSTVNLPGPSAGLRLLAGPDG
jgi:hypothetical protein